MHGGVILIGSLLWQDDLENGDFVRKKWRENHLLFKNKILVKVPIRYGRKSKGGVYTMVYSINCNKANRFGIGYVSPFKLEFKNCSDILSCAQNLVIAEGIGKNLINSWGSLGIIFNSKLNIIKQKEILDIFTFNSSDNNDWNKYKYNKESSVFSKKFLFRLPWPSAFIESETKELNKLDFLLATATKPTDYPSIEVIVNSILNDKSRYYFINNIKCGISTYQDRKIIDLLTKIKNKK